MKRKLLFAMLCIVSALGLRAQLTNGTVYWIQDVSTGQFISQGDNWSTRAVAQDVGGLGFEAVYVSDGVYKLNHVMWNTVRNATVGLGVDAYVDQTPVEWTLTASGDGYLIKNGNNYLANNGSENAYKEKGLNKVTNEADATVWKFLTRAEYDAAIQAYKDSKAASYAAQLNYSTVTTVTALETLITDASKFISKDYTNSITNPTIGSNWDGWTHGAISQRAEGAGIGNGCAEFWNGCGYAKQTVSNLPNGLYKVSFVSTYRPGGNNITLSSENASSPAFAYANDAANEFTHWVDVAAKANGRNGITVANGYQQSFYTYVTDGTLTLGVTADGWLGDNGYIWQPFGQFTLTYYTDKVSDEDITTLVATIPAEGTVPAGVYSNLNTLKNTLESTKTIAAYNALAEAITPANELVAPYATLVAEIAKAKALEMAAADAEAYGNVSTAAEATANTQSLMVAEYNYVKNNYTVAIDLGTWTTENAGTMTSQHWDGTNTTSYNEQLNGWGTATAWSTSYSQNITLPAGEYVFKVAGRHSQYSVLTLSVTSGETVLGKVNDFPIGDTGRGINTSGVTSFDSSDTFANNNNGRGWQWRYVPFTLDAETSVTISVVGNNPDAVQYQWLSFCNYTVQAKPSVAAAKVAYDQAVANANAVLTNATYANVGGTDRSNLQNAVDAAATETIAWYEAQTELINGYIPVFTAGVASWDAYVAEKTVAEMIGVTVSSTPATSAEAAAMVNTLKVAEYNKVVTDYPYSLTGKIGEFSTWTMTATSGGEADTPQTNNDQHWSAATHTYYEQGKNGWAANSFTVGYSKTTTLPAGEYVIKVAARASANVSGTISATATANTVAIANVGASSKGITTNGVASFDEGTFANNGTGYGWEWRFLPFTLTEETEVTININAASTSQHGWVSIADGELLSANDIATAIAYNEAAANTIEAADVANVTITRNVKVGFNTVVLPFDLTEAQVNKAFGTGAEVYAFSESSADANDVTINFNKVAAGTISANVPVLVKATVASSEQVFNGVEVVAATEAKVAGTNTNFVGTYAPIAAIAEGDYFVGNGALYKSAGATSMKAFRAYIDAQGTSGEVKLFIDGIATGIEAINGQAEAQKGAIYTLAGQRVQKAVKGLYIVNGKKVMVK